MKVWSMMVPLKRELKPAGVPSGLYLVVMEWMATITGDCVGYIGIFLRGEKFWRKIWRTVFRVAETDSSLRLFFLISWIHAATW
jgi:hypothetical protein